MPALEVPSHYRELKHEILKKFLHDREIGILLDIGSGVGVTTQALRRFLGGRIETVSVDKDLESLKFCQGDKILADACALPLKDNSINAIVAFDVIEHVVNDLILLKECYRVSKQNGLLFISTPGEAQLLNFISPEKEEHVRKGYNLKQLQKKVLNFGYDIIYYQGIYCCFIAFVEDVLITLAKKALHDESVPGMKGLTSRLIENELLIFKIYRKLFGVTQPIRWSLENMCPSSLKRSYILIASK